MKTLFIFLISLSSFATPTLFEISNVLKQVESSRNVKAIGDNGKAYGILQIHKAAIVDVNRFFGTNYIHEDAFDETCLEEIFFYYINAGVKRFIKKYDRRPTEQEIVRMWNGGIYQGYRIDATIKYYNKYKKYRNLC